MLALQHQIQQRGLHGERTSRRLRDPNLVLLQGVPAPQSSQLSERWLSTRNAQPGSILQAADTVPATEEIDLEVGNRTRGVGGEERALMQQLPIQRH